MTNQNKNVLLVGSSFSAIPIHSALKSHQLSTAVCGAQKNDPCHIYSDNSFFVDYSKKEDLLTLCSENSFNFIIPSCNDYAYLSSAWVAEQLNFPGFDSYETTLTLHTKHKFRQFTEKHGFPAPKAKNVNEVVQGDLDLSLPVLFKPVDSFSGRGLTKITDVSDFESATLAARNNSRSEQAIVEEFIEGSLHSHSAFIQGGQIIFNVFADEFCTIYPYQVNCSNIPTRLSSSIIKQVRECMSEFISLLNLSDGLLHTQFIVNDNDFWLIECMRRSPGDLYGRMAQLSTGVDYTALYTLPFIRQNLLYKISITDKRFIARHTLSIDSGDAFIGFSHNLPCSNFEYIPLKNSGEYLEKAPYDKAGIFFAEFSNIKQLHKLTSKMNNYLTIHSIGEDNK